MKIFQQNFKFCMSKLQNQLSINCTEFLKVIENEIDSIIILDVREKFEIQLADIPLKNQKGEKIVKVNMNLRTIASLHQDLLEEYLDKDKQIFCLCHHGVRSLQAQMILKQYGYNSINIQGGIDQLSSITTIPKY